jgi:type I restriction enzyme S subunit
MSSEWPITTLRAANVSLIDCEHRTPPAASSGYPYIAIPQIKNGRIDLSDVRRITRDHLTEWTRKAKPQPYDVVLSRRCNPGETAFVPPGLECALGQNLVLLRADGSKTFPPFLRWLVRGSAWWDQIGKFLNHGAVFESLKCADIPNFQLSLPPLNEQKAIARILGVLDDKIELNRGMNRTLEEMSTALFRSWFVDFDPVVAKAAARAPFGLAQKLAAIFPDTFTDSQLGPVPQGWSVRPIGDVVRAVGGSTPSTGEARYWSGGDIAWATPRDLSNLSDPVLLATERQITPAGLERITSGILPIGTVLLSSRAPIGYTAITEIPVAVNQGFIALDCNGPLPNHYVIEWVRENMEVIEGRANGTTFMEISKANFRPIPVVVPPPGVVAQFSAVAGPWWRQLIRNTHESRTLAALRDTLLNKLLSGELCVKDADKQVAAAV